MNPPKPVSGSHPAVSWFNRLREFCISNRVVDGPTYRARRGPGGTILEFLNQGGGGRPQSTISSNIKLYRIKEIFADVYRCRLWTGTAETGADVFVAKNPKLRNSISLEILDSVSFTYVYDASYVLRLATDANNAQEYQDIIPRILSNDIITASELTTSLTLLKIPGTIPTTVDVTWIDLNLDARAWCSTPNTDE